MITLSTTERNLLFFRTPSLWPQWPYLPLVRRSDDEVVALGLLYDFQGTSGRIGYRTTVFYANLFLVPATEAELLVLEKEVFDTWDELFAAGWRVD